MLYSPFGLLLTLFNCNKLVMNAPLANQATNTHSLLFGAVE